MFDIKCVYCKNFNPKEGCVLNLEEDNCSSYKETKKGNDKEDKPTCTTCVWQTNGYCDFELDSPLTCRRYKSLKEDL